MFSYKYIRAFSDFLFFFSWKNTIFQAHLWRAHIWKEQAYTSVFSSAAVNGAHAGSW